LNDIKADRYLLKSNSYMIDLESVDFITWKENEKLEGTYWAKLHIGSKEARYVCDNVDELRTLLEEWSNIKGNRIKIEDEEIVW